MSTNAALPVASLPVAATPMAAMDAVTPGISQTSPFQVGSGLSGRSFSDAASAAREFESVFVSMMLKTMRQSMSKDMFAGDDSDTFGGMFDSFMGQHIADNGGIGLAQFIADAGMSVDTSDALSDAQTKNAVSAQATPIQIEQKLKAYRDAAASAE
jgi:peptidoglycan hydrolase FlgJ